MFDDTHGNDVPTYTDMVIGWHMVNVHVMIH